MMLVYSGIQTSIYHDAGIQWYTDIYRWYTLVVLVYMVYTYMTLTYRGIYIESMMLVYSGIQTSIYHDAGIQWYTDIYSWYTLVVWVYMVHIYGSDI